MKLDRSTVWPYDERGQPRAFLYQRYGHPTGAEAEERLGELEGGEALLFGSGTSAVSACAFALLAPGQTVAVAEGAYYGTTVTLGELERWGLKVVQFDQTGPPPEADLIWLESPANPVLTLPDWGAATAHGARIVCDATVSTPVYLKALDEGADVALHSATKYLTGHHNALLGALITRDPDLHARLKEVRTRIGLTASPEAAAALLQGLETLEVRMRRHTETASELARRLEADPRVVKVRYPGFSGLISFDVDGDPLPVETATHVIANQTSLGGVRSSIESRHRWEGDRIPKGLLRLSVGLEDGEILWRDLDSALGSP